MTTEELWRSQSVELPSVTPAYLQGRAADTLRTAHGRNLFEYVSSAAAALVSLMAWFHFTDVWTRAGSALMVVASCVYIWRWRRLASPAAMPADLGAMDTLRFHRHELERQWQAYRGHWRWTVPLFLPALAFWYVGRVWVLSASDRSGSAVILALILLAGLGIAVWICESRAAKLRREIAMLDLLRQ